jgi:hypothetical protein
VVTGSAGTLINGMPSVSFPGAVLNAVKARLENGNDSLTLVDVQVANDLYVSLGEGNDFLSTSGVNSVGANATMEGGAVELYSVLLHEAGNALGLADNSMPGAVMNGVYSVPNTSLKISDISAIRQLYGARQDLNEPVGNNNAWSRATLIAIPAGNIGQSLITVRESLNTMSDVDFYRFQPIPGKEKVTVRLVAAGISLVKGQIEVLDRNGNKIGDAKTDSIFNNNLQVEIGSLQDHSSLFVRVARNANDVFAIGDYRLEFDYRDPSQQPSILPPVFDADANDGDESFPIDFVSVDALFSRAGMIDTETGLNDTLTTASRLDTTEGYLPNTRYELQAAIATLADRDLWRFRSPSTPSPVMHVHIDPVGLPANNMEVVLLTSSGARVAAQVTRKSHGGMSIEVANPTASTDYALFVRTVAGASIPAGNYVASVSFATNAGTNVRQLFQGELQAGSENFTNLTIGKTQLIRFDLSSQSTMSSSGIQMTIHDAKTGDIVTSFASASQTTRSDYVWLTAGDYVIRTKNIQQPGTTGVPNRFSLSAAVLSDDQGPRLTDPNSGLPRVTPGGTTSVPPVVVGPYEPPFLTPWFSNVVVTFINDFYRNNLQ